MPANLLAAREAAEAFRAKSITGQLHDRLPVDVYFVASVVLRFDLIPFPRLSELLDSPAALKPNLKEIYVDDDLDAAYSDPRAKPWERDRLRFSIAHEIGHVEMHAGRVGDIRCEQIEDLITLFNRQDAERFEIEKEANEFAGRLIVPVEKLKEALEGFIELNGDPKWRDSALLRGQFGELVGRKFGINSEALRLRLDREGLWPAEWTEGG